MLLFQHEKLDITAFEYWVHVPFYFLMEIFDFIGTDLYQRGRGLPEYLLHRITLS